MSRSRPLLSPMLAFRNCHAALEWYAEAFGAVELFRLTERSGKIVHAEMTVGGSLVMVSEEMPEYNASPLTVGRTTVILNLVVENVDAFVDRAMAHGAKLIFPVSDQFYGDRSGRIEDPHGYVWIVSTPVETVDPAEMQRRMEGLGG